MKNCPRCRDGVLIDLFDGTSHFKSAVCPKCAYYQSNSEGFVLYPELFHDIGPEILARMETEVRAQGLSESEAKVWLSEEPEFTRRIVTPLDGRRKGNRTEELDKYMGMTYVIIRTRENGIVASG